MKLVTEFLTPGEAELAASHLEAAGIPTYVSNSGIGRLLVSTGHAGGIGLWVVVDEQLLDAQQLLENPEHEVKSKLSEAQQQAIRETVADQGMSGALGLLFKILAATILMAIITFAVTRY